MFTGRKFARIYPLGGFDPRIGGYRPIPRDGKPVPLPPQDGWDPIAGGYHPRKSAPPPMPPEWDGCVVLRPDPEEDSGDRIEEQ